MLTAFHQRAADGGEETVQGGALTGFGKCRGRRQMEKHQDGERQNGRHAGFASAAAFYVRLVVMAYGPHWH
ncbi:hypothetical protein VQ056_16660 [Paenibacillus sp. JTLBN-2024]